MDAKPPNRPRNFAIVALVLVLVVASLIRVKTWQLRADDGRLIRAYLDIGMIGRGKPPPEIYSSSVHTLEHQRYMFFGLVRSRFVGSPFELPLEPIDESLSRISDSP